MASKTNLNRAAGWQASVLAILLKGKGFTVVSWCEPTHEEDGEVVIDDRVHVQVGFHHINVVAVEGNAFRFSPASSTFSQLVKDLRLALRGRQEAA